MTPEEYFKAPVFDAIEEGTPVPRTDEFLKTDMKGKLIPINIEGTERRKANKKKKESKVWTDRGIKPRNRRGLQVALGESQEMIKCLPEISGRSGFRRAAKDFRHINTMMEGRKKGKIATKLAKKKGEKVVLDELMIKAKKKTSITNSSLISKIRDKL